jgi:hypothetical protein
MRKNVISDIAQLSQEENNILIADFMGKKFLRPYLKWNETKLLD